MSCISVALGYDVTSLAIPPAGDVVVAGWHEGRVTVHRRTDGALIHELPPQPAAVWSLAFSPDGTRLAIGSDDNPNSPDGAVEIWRTSPWTPIAALPIDDIGGTWSLDWTADDSRLVVGHTNGVVRLWDLTTTSVVRIFDAITCELPKVACARRAPLLAHGCEELVQIVRLADGTLLHEWGGHPDWVQALAWSPTGPLVGVCAGDSVVRLWDADQGTSVWQLALGSTSESLAFSPDGQRLACGGSDGRVRIVRVADAVVETELVGHRGWVRAVTWAADGQVIVSGGTDGMLRIWY
jgi:WD40 repeat protein